MTSSLSEEVIDVIKKGYRIEAVVIHNRSLTQAIRTRIAIDATGDGVLARHAGAEVMSREDEWSPMPAGFMYSGPVLRGVSAGCM